MQLRSMVNHVVVFYNEKWFPPPVFEEDEDKTRTATFLTVVLKFCVIISGFSWILTLATTTDITFSLTTQLAFYVALILVPIALLYAIRRGQVYFTGIVWATTIWLIVAVGSFVDDGLNSPAFPYLMIAVLMAGFVASIRISTIFAFISLMYGLLLYVLQTYSLLPEPVSPSSALRSFMSYLPGLMMVPMLVYIYRNSITQLMEQVRRTEADKRAAEIYKEVNAQLQKEIDERKRVELELVKAKEEAEIANRSKDEFLSNMSHELRTPLNGILGYAQILQRDLTSNDVHHEGLEIIRESGEHLLMLIKDILDIAKIEAGKMELKYGGLDFQEFNGNLINLMRARAEQKGLAFYAELAPELPSEIVIDETRLRQVLINLLSNAVKFTEDGHVQFKVSVPSPPPPNSAQCVIRFEVSDTGIGMQRVDLERIFMPFEQVGDLNDRAEGTGLGLAISQRLVKAMGSALKVGSQFGRGSRFWFDLAVVARTQPRPVAKRTPARTKITGYKRPNPYRVLIIDDRPENRLLLVRLLTSIGFQVTSAGGGIEGYELAVESAPDLVLTDLVMPRVDGYEVIKRLRDVPDLSHTRIVAISADAQQASRDRSLAVGADAFIIKPVNFQLLLEVMQQQLSIVWLYNEEPPVASPIDPEPKVEIIAPPQDELDLLLDLVTQGAIPKIRDRADVIEQLDGRYVAFASKLREYALEYDDQSILTLVQGQVN